MTAKSKKAPAKKAQASSKAKAGKAKAKSKPMAARAAASVVMPRGMGARPR